MNNITRNTAKICTKFKMQRKNVKFESWFFGVVVKLMSPVGENKKTRGDHKLII